MEDTKEFRVIPGHRQYVVSSDGVVKRIAGSRKHPEGKVLSPAKHRVKGEDCYLYATLQTTDVAGGDGEIEDAPRVKPVGVHRLVALAWIGPAPEGKPWVNHKNGNKQDNRVENLEWTSISENLTHKFDTGLYKTPTGVDHWRYGKKASERTRRMLSEQKKGERHPKFKGWYEKDGVRYSSLREAAEWWESTPSKILLMVRKGRQGWRFVAKEEAEK